MSGEKSIKRNYIYNVSYQILTLITPLVTAPYISRVLGADGIGVYSFTASIVAYFVMVAALGTLNYGNREISYLQNDRANRSVIFWEIELLKLLSVAVCLFAYFIFLFFCKKNTALYIIQIFSLLSVAADIAWLLQGLEEFGKVVFRNVILKTVNIAFIFIAVQSKDDLLLYVGGQCIMEFLANLSIWAYVPKYIDKPAWKSLRPLRHLKPTLVLFVPTVATTIYTSLDKTMLGLFTTTDFENGYYEQAIKLSKMVLTLITALGAVMIPRIGFYFNEGKREEAKALLFESFHFVWFLGIPLCLGLAGTAFQFVPWYYGPGYEKVSVLLVILSLLIPIIGISNVTGIQYLITTKRENILTRTVCIGAVINFFLNLILIPHWFSIGAAIGSVAAELVITILQVYYLRKELSPRKIFSSSRNYLFAGVPMLLLLIVENHYFSSSILHTFIMVASGVFSYFALLFLIKDDFLLKYSGSIISRIRPKK